MNPEKLRRANKTDEEPSGRCPSGGPEGLPGLHSPSPARPVTVTTVSSVPNVCQAPRPVLYGLFLPMLPMAARGRSCYCVISQRRKQAQRDEGACPGHRAGRWQGGESEPRLAGYFNHISRPLRLKTKPACRAARTEATWSPSFLSRPPCHPASNYPPEPRWLVSLRPRSEKGHVQLPSGHLYRCPYTHQGGLPQRVSPLLPRASAFPPRTSNNLPKKERPLKSLTFRNLSAFSWPLGEMMRPFFKKPASPRNLHV